MRLNKVICFFIIVLLIISFMIILKNIINPTLPEIKYWKEYTVKEGDTLYTIIDHDNGYDFRNIIDLVKEHNNIENSIYPSQVIEIPVW